MAYLNLQDKTSVKFRRYWAASSTATSWTIYNNTVYDLGSGGAQQFCGYDSSTGTYNVHEMQLKFPQAVVNPVIRFSGVHVAGNNSSNRRLSESRTMKVLWTTSPLSTAQNVGQYVINNAQYTTSTETDTDIYVHYTYTTQQGYVYSFAYPYTDVTLTGNFAANTTYYVYFSPSNLTKYAAIWNGQSNANYLVGTSLTDNSYPSIFHIYYNENTSYTATYTKPTNSMISAPAGAGFTYQFTGIDGAAKSIRIERGYTLNFFNGSQISGTPSSKTITGAWDISTSTRFTNPYMQQTNWTASTSEGASVRLALSNSTHSTSDTYALSGSMGTASRNWTLYPVFTPYYPSITVKNGSTSLISSIGVYSNNSNSMISNATTVTTTIPSMNLRYIGLKLKDIYGVKTVVWTDPIKGEDVSTSTPYYENINVTSGLTSSATYTFSVKSITYRSYTAKYDKSNAPNPGSNSSIVMPANASTATITYNNTITMASAASHPSVTTTSTAPSSSRTASIIINANGGTGGSTLTSKGVDAIATTTTFTFSKWKVSGTSQTYSAGTTYTLNATNFANLQTLADGGTMTFVPEFTTATSSSSSAAGYSAITLPRGSALANEGLTLLGFSTNADDTTPMYPAGGSFTPTNATTTLYAIWGQSVGGVRIYDEATAKWNLYTPYIYSNGEWKFATPLIRDNNSWEYVN